MWDAKHDSKEEISILTSSNKLDQPFADVYLWRLARTLHRQHQLFFTYNNTKLINLVKSISENG